MTKKADPFAGIPPLNMEPAPVLAPRPCDQSCCTVPNFPRETGWVRPTTK